MNIQKEEIFLNGLTSGTTLTLFSTYLLSNSQDIYVPTILQFDNLGLPISLSTFDGLNLWVMNNSNVYQPISAISNNYITGHSSVQKVDRIISDIAIENIKERFTASVSNEIAALNIISSAHTEYVFSKYNEIEDFYVNIKLNRTFGTLDTLNIYNNLVNSMPVQESSTGVLFGRLMAQQSIKDASGNNIKIPLRNVPVGIFNTSETYPQSTSVDDNGDRIFLNIKESATQQEYFNVQSFNSDSNYLRSGSTFTSVPNQYKHISTTNENGEFIIYDAPIGSQIFILDVDLLKQGLTKDEIALNFFPFPADDNAGIDTIPSFYFKQFPIDIVPAWGTIQTGYTELDITINLDLRKWATFYIPPMAFKGYLLGSNELSQSTPSINVDIRDMSKSGFPKHNIPVVEIHNIYDKDPEQTLLWNTEFAQLKKSANFFEHGFKAFKVRANMYDPIGFRTDQNGTPNTYPTSQGVWLAGYQFKFYYNDPSTTFRTTGFQYEWLSSGWVGRDNFHLNRGDTSTLSNEEANESQYTASTFPYDQPWSHLYPIEYTIPARPSILNFNRNTIGNRALEIPEYKDGDLVGLNYDHNIKDTSAGGYGSQFSSENNHWFSNRFSQEVSRSYIYRYEDGVSWQEKYSNGFEPNNPGFIVSAGDSNVVNGEKFQRVECGYGYWLRPGGWAPVAAMSWGDVIFPGAVQKNVGLSSSFGPGILHAGVSYDGITVSQDQFMEIYNINDKDIVVALDSDSAFSEGPLDIYRIIDPIDLSPKQLDVVPTFATYNFQSFYYQRGYNIAIAGLVPRLQTAVKNSGGNDREMLFSIATGVHGSFGYAQLWLRIKNNGSIDVTIPNNGIDLAQGDTKEFLASSLNLHNGSITLPGNSDFDFNTGKYNKSDYSMELFNIRHFKDDGTEFNFNHSDPDNFIIGNTLVSADVDPINYWLITKYEQLRTQYNSDDGTCELSSSDNDVGGSNSKWEHNVKMDGALFKTHGALNDGTFKGIAFYTSRITSELPSGCPSGSFDGGVIQSIPIEIYS